LKIGQFRSFIYLKYSRKKAVFPTFYVIVKIDKISKWLRENRKTDFICQIKKAAPVKALPEQNAQHHPCPKTISPQSRKERRERNFIRIPERGILIMISMIYK